MTEEGAEVKEEVNVSLSKELVELIDENRGELTRAEFIDLCVRSFLKKVNLNPVIEAPEAYKKVEKTSAQPPNGCYKLSWTSAMLTYGVGDTLTSYLAFQAGLHEINPIMILLGNIIAIIFFKIAIFSVLLLISYFFINKKWLYLSVPIITTIVGLISTINNIMQLLQA